MAFSFQLLFLYELESPICGFDGSLDDYYIFSGVGIDKIEKSKTIKEKNGWKKTVVAISFIANIGILVFFKYFDFLLDNLNIFLDMVGMSVVTRSFDIILPVGISFYTFQALGYTVDVYRGDIEAEKNIFQYALFVSFFLSL